MRSLERRYNKITDENPGWAPLICFSAAVAGQGFSSDRLARWFNKLISEDEYLGDPEAKKEWMAHFIQRTNMQDAYWGDAKGNDELDA